MRESQRDLQFISYAAYLLKLGTAKGPRGKMTVRSMELMAM